MTKAIKAGGVPEALVPSLVLGCGLVALVGLVYSVDVPLLRVMSGVGTLCVLALWWMLRRQGRTLLRWGRRSTASARRRWRRSTMRFI